MNHLRTRTAAALATLLASTAALAEGGSYPTYPPQPGTSGAAGGSVTAPPPSSSMPPGHMHTMPGAAAGTPMTPPAGADETPLVIVVPTWFANDPNLANGCWARLYDKTDFRGTVFPIVGPVNIPSNRAGFITGFEMGRNYDSLQLGSRATLTVWDSNDYKNRSTTFGPGQSIPDLDRRMGATEEIRSMKLTCSS